MLEEIAYVKALRQETIFLASKQVFVEQEESEKSSRSGTQGPERYCQLAKIMQLFDIHGNFKLVIISNLLEVLQSYITVNTVFYSDVQY